MRTGSHPQPGASAATTLPRPSPPPGLRDAMAVAELLLGVFRRDLAAFYPQAQVLVRDPKAAGSIWAAGPTSG